MDEGDEFRLGDHYHFVAALNATAHGSHLANQLCWVLTNHPQWWDLVVSAEVKVVDEPIPPEMGWWWQGPREIRLHGGRTVQEGWLTRDELRDLFGADVESLIRRETTRTKLLRLHMRRVDVDAGWPEEFRVEKVAPHGWVILPLKGKMRFQAFIADLRDNPFVDSLEVGVGCCLMFATGFLGLAVVAGVIAFLLSLLGIDIFWPDPTP